MDDIELTLSLVSMSGVTVDDVAGDGFSGSSWFTGSCIPPSSSSCKLCDSLRAKGSGISLIAR